jgi:hypothetical protein
MFLFVPTGVNLEHKRSRPNATHIFTHMYEAYPGYLPKDPIRYMKPKPYEYTNMYVPN